MANINLSLTQEQFAALQSVVNLAGDAIDMCQFKDYEIEQELQPSTSGTEVLATGYRIDLNDFIAQ